MHRQPDTQIRAHLEAHVTATSRGVGQGYLERPVAHDLDDAWAKAASAHEASAHEAAAHETSAHDAALHDASAHEASAHEASAQDALPATTSDQLAASKLTLPPLETRNLLSARFGLGGVPFTSPAFPAFTWPTPTDPGFA